MSVAMMRSGQQPFFRNIRASVIAPPCILHFQNLPSMQMSSTSCRLFSKDPSAHAAWEPVKYGSTRRTFIVPAPLYTPIDTGPSSPVPLDPELSALVHQVARPVGPGPGVGV